MAAIAGTRTVSLTKNIGLDDAATGIQTSTIDEPTAAGSGDELFVTGNWFASHSDDAGSTWTLVDPFTALPSAAGGFCCDQVTLHEVSRDMWIWLLQYSDDGNQNVFRVAISKPGASGPWSFWDFAPATFDTAWASDTMFDFPDVATTDNNLYITYNVFTISSGAWLAAIVFKFSLDELAALGSLHYEHFTITSHGSLRLTRGATSDMFFASHNGVDPVRIFQWPDAAGSGISNFDVSASTAWSGTGAFSAPGPGGEWLGRLDSRITGGWVVGNQAGFLWAANAQSGRPQPYTKAIVVDTSTQAVVAEPDIWHDQFAWAYAAACPNSDGVVGVALFSGGGASDPTHSVGFLDGTQWNLVISRASTHGPAGGSWGDYLSCRLADPDTTEWVASGYTLQGGTDRRFVEPQYVQFGIGSGGGGGSTPSVPPPFPGRLLKFPPLTKGPDVSAWQQKMTERGFTLVVDGAYGKNSKAACIQFQQQQGLSADGIVGPNTWEKTFGP